MKNKNIKEVGFMNMQKLIGKVRYGAKKNAPELLLGAGLVTGTACVITASRATIKAKEILSDRNNDLHILEIDRENGLLSEEDAKAAIKKVYVSYAFDLVKTYAIPVALYTATVATVFSSYKIQKNRQIALSAALTACTTAYATLVGKLENGAKHGLTAQEVLDGVEGREVVTEDGEVVIEKYQGNAIRSAYSVRFDRMSPCWSKDKFQNESTLRSEENWANDRLRLQGFLFLNEVHDRLGLPKTVVGQIVGWHRNSNGDGYVDFGIVDAATYNSNEYHDNAFDLDFNVDGDILNRINELIK